MRFRIAFFSGLAIALLGVGCGENKSDSAAGGEISAAPGELHWLTNFGAAKEQARSEKKMLMMNFTGSDWCPPCIQLEKQLFSKPEFAQYAAKNLVLLEVDFPRRKELSAELSAANKELARDYRIEGFPTVIVLNSDSKPLGKFGYVPGLGPAEVIEALEKARAEE